jgi:EmrB/QacA subfamily drug resistance transporter
VSRTIGVAAPTGRPAAAVGGTPPAVSYDEQGAPRLTRSQTTATLAGVLSAMLLAALDQTIVGTAMPRVIADLHGFEQYAWVVTAYLVASTAVVPIVGKLSDLYGRKSFLLGGVALFIFASALCGAAQTMTQLVAFRGLQGVGAGVVQAMAFTTIADLFPPARRGKVAGLFGSVFGLSSVIGPAVGGFLTDGPGWRWVFYANLPIGLVALAILVFSFPNPRVRRETRPTIDYLGAATLLLAVVPLLVALSWGGREHPWGSPTIVGMLALAAAMTAAFLWVEGRAAEPIIPLGLFRSSIVSIAALVAGLTAVAMFGTTLFIPLFMQAVIGQSATGSGAVLTPLMLAMVGSSTASGQIISRIGRYRYQLLFGVATTAAGLFLLSRMGTQTGYGAVVVNMLVTGIGLGSTMPVLTLAIQNAVPQRLVGVATSTSQFCRSMGGALGAAVFGSVLVNRFAPAFHAALPADVAATIPPGQMASFENPQALMNPEMAGALHQGLAGGASASAALLDAVRVALASSLHDVFLGAALVMVVATALALFLREIPLRGRTPSAVPPDVGAH